jgi:hypothetical protein
MKVSRLRDNEKKSSRSVLRIRIRKDPHYFAGSGSGILEGDPDSRHLINFFSVEKYCE